MIKMEIFAKEIEKLKEEGLYRRLNIVETAINPKIKIGGREFLLFSSNNYLGLANHPQLKKEAKKAIDIYGVGAGASRLISGSMLLHKELEERIARFKNSESAILFTCGYMANIGAIPVLVDRGDLIILDRDCHASIVEGAYLSKAKILVYPHQDMDVLEKILKKYSKEKKLIISEGVFSMEGSICKLPEILSLSQKYNAFFLLDDAHATGVLGREGRGTLDYYGIKDENIIQMGTFSKALGSLGGFITGSKKLIDYLRNKAKSFIYTTALPPSVLATSIASLNLVENNPNLRIKLWEKIEFLKKELKDLRLNILNSPSQIIPILIGDNERVVRVSNFLFEKGIYIPAIRTPTVKKKRERLRLTIMANHKKRDLTYLIEILKEMRKKGIL